MKKHYTIEDMTSYVSAKGGKCLSKKYIDETSPLKWRCEKGHTWEADFQIIRQGGWCQACLKQQKRKDELFDELKLIAKERGGKLLSDEYINSTTYLLFECHQGHQWKAIQNNIKNGSWCPICSGNVKLTLNDLKEVASKRGGLCLATEYKNNHTKIKWQCAEGHFWMATPHNIIQRKTWCSKCIHKTLHDPKKIKFEDLIKMATDKGGKLLSEVYINNHTPLLWQCLKGHEWKAFAKDIKKGHWCPKCARVAKLTLKDMQMHALKMKGKCLSAEYVNTSEKLEWQCEQGHTWMATPKNIIYRKSWCKICIGKTLVENLGVHSQKKIINK